MSILKDGINENGQDAVCIFNNFLQLYCIEANAKEGWCVRFKQTDVENFTKEKCDYNWEKINTEKVFGDIVIVPFDDIYDLGKELIDKYNLDKPTNGWDDFDKDFNKMVEIPEGQDPPETGYKKLCGCLNKWWVLYENEI
jgi:hypothetical protein